MRWLLVTLLLLSLGATYPRHRRFMQKTLPAGGSSCIPVTGTAINYATWSQAFDNAAWSSFANMAAPVVTADVPGVVAPACADVVNVAGCGVAGTVDRVEFPATALTKFSAIRNIYSSPEQTNNGYVYAKAGPGGCAGGLEIGTSSATEYYFTSNAITSNWTRISDLEGGFGALGSTLFIGNLAPAARPSDTLGAATRTACDVYLWQADAASTGNAQRPVKTTSAAATQGPGCY